jgi:hypothetical protein
MHAAIQTHLVQSYIAELRRSSRAGGVRVRPTRPLAEREKLARRSSRSDDVRVSMVRRVATRLAL